MKSACNVLAVQCMSKNKFPFNIGALGIKYFQKTNYSHYALCLIEPTGRITFYDSTPWGVTEKTRKMFLSHYTDVKYFDLGQVGYNQFENFFDVHRGKSYGFGQVMGLLLKLFKIVSRNPFGKGASYIICNELIILYMNFRGITNIKDTDSIDLNGTDEILRGL